jgi:imidazole glycerol-phosphate synthase subunit HisH
MIAIVDSGLGNLRSVVRALVATGTSEDVRLVENPRDVRDASRVVVPGQGAFGEAAAALRPDAPLGSAIVEGIRSGKPYLGICLGMQVLFHSSEESPGHPGLGVFPGRVRRLPGNAVDAEGRRLKVPNIGWSRIAQRGSHPVLEVQSGDPWFYFVHSYHAVPEQESLIAAVCTFGDTPITAAVARDNVVGVQFHPEKSQRTGLELLRAFVGWQC